MGPEFDSVSEIYRRDRTMKMVECGKMLSERRMCLRGVVSVVGDVVMCALIFLVFVNFHMFFAFCTYAKKIVSDAISANVVCRCYMYGCIEKCRVI
jgi:hypothetical protein